MWDQQKRNGEPNNRKINQTQSDLIQSIAELCPMIGGPKAVYRARALADLLHVDFISNDCSSATEKSITANDQRYELSVQPNPANDQIQINYSFESEEARQLILYNAIGKKVTIIDLYASKGNLSIILENYPTGVYFLALKENGILVLTEKIIVQR